LFRKYSREKKFLKTTKIIARFYDKTWMILKFRLTMALP